MSQSEWCDINFTAIDPKPKIKVIRTISFFFQHIIQAFNWLLPGNAINLAMSDVMMQHCKQGGWSRFDIHIIHPNVIGVGFDCCNKNIFRCC
jgi:hypothetical protein